MCQAKAISDIYEQNRQAIKYVHVPPRGPEAIQIALAFRLLPCDYVCPCYPDDSLLLGLGFSPYTLMLQLLAKHDDIFSNGRAYYGYASYKGADKPTILSSNSHTGIQAIPATGIAQGLQHLKKINSPLYRRGPQDEEPLAVCLLDNVNITEGEVSEAFQAAASNRLPIIYIVQNHTGSDKTATAEAGITSAYELAAGLPGMSRLSIDGADFSESFFAVREVIRKVREGDGPWILQAEMPTLMSDNSGNVREFNRKDRKETDLKDPLLKIEQQLKLNGCTTDEMLDVIEEARNTIKSDFNRAVSAADPDPSKVKKYVFLPTPVTGESGERNPGNGNKVFIAEASAHALTEIMESHPEVIVLKQNAGRKPVADSSLTDTIGGEFKNQKVFSTNNQKAYIIGSSVGLATTGIKPIIEVQSSDSIYGGMNQLVNEVSKSCYLSCGKFPIPVVIRIPVGTYESGGPYLSISNESALLSVRGIKVVYPSNAADMKGLMKAAFYDPNPVVIFEHRGLRENSIPGAQESGVVEPDEDYVIPLGKGRIALEATPERVEEGDSCCIITYGMGVYWAMNAAEFFPGRVEIIDLRTLYPLDENLVYDTVWRHGKCLVLTEEQLNNSFGEALSGRISSNCFHVLDAPVQVMGALSLPAVPMNTELERAVFPDTEKVKAAIDGLLNY